MRLLSRREMILIAVFSLFNNFAISVILIKQTFNPARQPNIVAVQQ